MKVNLQFFPLAVSPELQWLVFSHFFNKHIKVSVIRECLHSCIKKKLCLYTYEKKIDQSDSNFILVSPIQLPGLKSLESRPKFSANLWCIVFSTSADPLLVLQKSTICALSKAKSVDQQTFHPPLVTYRVVRPVELEPRGGGGTPVCAAR